MIAGVLGIAGFVLALFAIGAVAEKDGAKALMFGAAFAVCSMIAIAAGPGNPVSDRECWIDWDGRTNSTVCD